MSLGFKYTSPGAVQCIAAEAGNLRGAFILLYASIVASTRSVMADLRLSGEGLQG